MKRLTLTLAVILAPTLAATQDARNCGPRASVVDWLASRHGETPQFTGLSANNRVVEVFASDETGTWTIAVTLPNGVTCLVASGQAFETLADDLPDDGDDI